MPELELVQFKSLYWLAVIPVGTILILLFGHHLHTPAQWLVVLGQKQYRHTRAQDLAATGQLQAGMTGHLPAKINYVLILSLLCLSLAEPYQTGERLPDPPEHRDIVFLVDTSISMILRDYIVDGQRTDRLSVMKSVLNHFIDSLQGNRIKLIAYSEQAYTVVPFTTDYELLKFQLKRLESASLTGRSSDLSKALLYALKQETSVNDQTQTSHPVFIMLTDAHRPVRNIDPRVSARYVAEHGIRLHTIAIGAASYEAEDKQKINLIYHPTSFQLLEGVAKNGNGRFFWAKDARSMSDALATINSTEKRRIQTEPVYIRIPLYFWPLSVLIGWLLLYYLIQLTGIGYSYNRREAQ